MIGRIPFIKRGPWRPFLLRAALVAITFFLAFDAIAKRYRLGIDWQVERCLPDTRAVLIDLRSDVPKRGEMIAFRGRDLEPLFADGTHMVIQMSPSSFGEHCPARHSRRLGGVWRGSSKT